MAQFHTIYRMKSEALKRDIYFLETFGMTAHVWVRARSYSINIRLLIVDGYLVLVVHLIMLVFVRDYSVHFHNEGMTITYLVAHECG